MCVILQQKKEFSFAHEKSYVMCVEYSYNSRQIYI